MVDVKPNPELEAVPELGWFNHRVLVLAAAAIAGLYFALALVAEDMNLASPIGILVVTTLALRAAWCILLLSRCCTWSSFPGRLAGYCENKPCTFSRCIRTDAEACGSSAVCSISR